VLLTPRVVSSVEDVVGLRRRAEPRRRGVYPIRRVPTAIAALGCFAVPRAARRCSPRLKLSPETLDWVPTASPPPLAAGRRRQPSAVALRRVPHARVLSRRIKIRRL
jgi:hypothetical protein